MKQKLKAGTLFLALVCNLQLVYCWPWSTKKEDRSEYRLPQYNLPKHSWSVDLTAPLLDETACHTLLSEHLTNRGTYIPSNQDPSKLIFFLHVPRTAGKTYSSCFLKPSHPPSKRCHPSYDLLSYNISTPNCVTLNSHDDMSISQYFPPHAATIMQLRKPEDRIISIYEFATEVAARKVNQTQAQVVLSLFKTPPGGGPVNTMHVWPWSKLVLWFHNDMRERNIALRDQHLQSQEGSDAASEPVWTQHWSERSNRWYYYNKVKNESLWELPDPEPVLDPYNNSLVMPLEEWVDTPIAQELAHEGSSLQLLGLTNYSHWEEAGALRQCMFRYESVRKNLSNRALELLPKLKHVGLTEKLYDSVRSLAAELKIRMTSTAYRSPPKQFQSFEDPEIPAGKKFRYNSTMMVDSGLVTSITISEARKIAGNAAMRLRDIDPKVNNMKQKLLGLVRKEDDWFSKKTDNGDDNTSADDNSIKMTRRLLNSHLSERMLAAGTKKVPEVDSPWKKEIEPLDMELSTLMHDQQKFRREMNALQAAGLFVPPLQAKGRAVQLIPDTKFIRHGRTLGQEFTECQDQAKQKAAKRRGNSFRHLRTGDDKGFLFSKQARKDIPEKVLEKIRRLNPIDVALWELGAELLEKKMGEQVEADILETLPDPPPPNKNNNKGVGSDTAATGAAIPISSETESNDGSSTSGTDSDSDPDHDEL